jgi:agmatine deiminase
MKYILIVCTIFCSIISVHAQEPILPKGFAPGEEALMSDYLQQINSQPNGYSIQVPPGLPVRTAAQWEEVQALVITWTGFPAILREIVRAAQQECQVIIHCADSNNVKNNLTNYNIPLTNLKFIEVGFNSIWIRDYAANTCYLNDVDSLILVDWIYNRPRPLDDQIPAAYSSLLGIPLFETATAPNNLMNTGGNFMSDGMGTAMASKLILDENDGAGIYNIPYPTQSETQIDQLLQDFQGINRYIKMDMLPYDGIHHIDMHMKFLDEETILVGKFPEGISDGPQIEANIQYVLSNFQSSFGTDYKIIRVPMPPSTSGNYAGAPFGNGFYRTYSNFVIVNKTIILPVYREEFDTTAVRVIQEQMPGYKIVTIDSDNSNANSDLNQNIVSQSGVIHCITHTVGVKDPLRIVHNDLEDTWDETNPYSVDAIIQHSSGINNATIYWTTDTTQPYLSVNMTLSNASNDTWTGYIPAQPAGTEIFYYIQALANNGKQQVRPMPAPEGYWNFKVLDQLSAEQNLSQVFSQPLFPNPSKGITCIPVFYQWDDEVTISVVDMMGRYKEMLFHGKVKNKGMNQFFVNTIEYTSGVYQVILESKLGRFTQPLIVK